MKDTLYRFGMKDTLYRWIGTPFLRLGRLVERMMDHDNMMVGMAGLGIMVLTLGSIIFGIVLTLVALFGGFETPMYETVGC